MPAPATPVASEYPGEGSVRCLIHETQRIRRRQGPSPYRCSPAVRLTDGLQTNLLLIVIEVEQFWLSSLIESLHKASCGRCCVIRVCGGISFLCPDLSLLIAFCRHDHFLSGRSQGTDASWVRFPPTAGFCPVRYPRFLVVARVGLEHFAPPHTALPR